MDQLVLIAVSFTFLFVQLASCQRSAGCRTAESNLLSSNCFLDIPADIDSSIICGTQCQAIQNTYFDRCAGEVSKLRSYACFTHKFDDIQPNLKHGL